MSQFLGFESYLVPLGASIIDTHTIIRDAVVAKNWQIVHDSTLTQIQSVLGTFADATYLKEQAFNNTFDNSSTSYAASNAALPIWIGIQLVGSRQFTSVDLVVASSSTDTPKDFTIDWSDDGSSWTTISTVVNQTGWTANERRRFAIPATGSHKYWRIYITAKNGSTWVSLLKVDFMDAAGNIAKYLTNTTYFNAIPPVSEQIGDTKTRQLVQFRFTPNTMSLRPMLQTLAGSPQIVSFRQKTAGNVQYGFTLGSATVLQDPATQNATNTAKQNLRFLYDAIRKSSDPTILGWNWSYQTQATQNADDTNDYIVGICKTVVPNIAVTPNTNVNGAMIGVYVPQNMVMDTREFYPGSKTTDLTIDLVNGFIYYMQINSRGIAIATKTNTSYYGPIHACYADNTKALASKPNSPHADIVELFVGYDNDSTNLSSVGYSTHYWQLASGQGYAVSDLYSTNAHSVGRYSLRTTMMDYSPAGSAIANVTLAASNLWTSDSYSGNDFQIHRVSLPSVSIISNNSQVYFSGNVVLSTILCPQADISDWYKFRGTAVSESLVLIADTQISTTLATGIDITATPTTLDLVSTNGFNSTGFVYIGDELFQYTGISGNTLTGVTRSKYGTTPKNQFIGDNVYQCLWFTIINGGALLCGYNKPS